VTGAVVRNNLIVNTKGPGIMVYGASSGNPADANLIEGNVIANSRTHAGIVVGGGPSVVRHNIVSGNQLSGIYVYDYNTRGLMHQIVVENNTAAVNIGSDIYVVSPSTYQPQHVTIRNNYTFSSPGVPGIVLPADLTGWTVTGNVQGATNTALTNAAQRFVNVIPYNLDKLDKVWELLGSLQGPFSLNETKTVFARLHGFLHRAS
jgi:hypothetical protein